MTASTALDRTPRPARSGSTGWSGCSTWSGSRSTCSAASARRAVARRGCSAGRSPARRWWPPAARCPRTARCTRCTPTSSGPATRAIPIVYEIERVRDGRSFTTRRVLAIQHGEAIFALSASFQLPQQGWSTPSPMPAACPRRSRCPTSASARRVGGQRGWLAQGPAADRRPLRRRAAVVGRRARAPPSEPHAGLDARRRQAARRPAAARLHADLRQRPDAARLGAGPPRRGRGGRCRWRASTTPCGSTARSAPTSGCSTRATRRARPAARGLATGRFTQADGTLVATAVQEGLVRVGAPCRLRPSSRVGRHPDARGPHRARRRRTARSPACS